MSARRRISPRIIFWGNLAFGFAVLALVMRAYGGEAFAVLLSGRSPWSLVGFLAAVVLTIVTLTWRWGFTLSGLHRPPSLPRLVLYRSAAHSLAVLVPSGKLGGDPLRAWLVTRSGVPPAHAIASVVVDRTLEIGAKAPFSIVFVMMLLQHGVPQLERVLVTVAVATGALIVGVVVAIRRLQGGAGLVSALVRHTGADRWSVVDAQMQVISESESSTAELAGQHRRMLIGFAVGLGANLLVVAEFALLMRAFGLPSDAVSVVAAIFATATAHMLPIPAGIGVLEGAQIWIFQMLGYPTDVGLAVGLSIRLRELLWMAPGIAYWIARSLRGALVQSRFT